MDIPTIWLITLSVATPIAGVVGFAIQWRHLKKTQLENEKLQLEIETLKKKNADAENRIIHATNEEILKISYSEIPMYSIREDFPPSGPLKRSIKDKIIIGTVIAALAFMAIYLAYDLYRFAIWVSSKL